MLIRSNKAIMYQSAEDVAQALGWGRATGRPLPAGAAGVFASPASLTPRQRKAYDTFPAGERLDAEGLAELWQVPLWEASSLVGQLRAKGLVATDPYKCYYKI